MKKNKIYSNTFLLYLSVCLFISSCCNLEDEDFISPYGLPEIIKLTLTIDGEDYEVTFVDNKAQIDFPKFSVFQSTAKIKDIRLSPGTTVDVSIGDNLDISERVSNLLAKNSSGENKYQVTYKENPLQSFTKGTFAIDKFLPRAFHKTLVYKDKLWVIAGNTSNDVWSSEDGIQWKEETMHADFSIKNVHQAVVYKDKMWVIGGQRSLFGVEDLADDQNDVWSSVDGINWDLKTASAAFSGRHSHTVTVFMGKMWLIGGGNLRVNALNTANNDVWSSIDGINWTLEINAPFVGRRLHATTVFEDRLWVSGGVSVTPITGIETRLNDIWSSADGITWREETPNAAFPPRERFDLVNFKNKLWVMGGITNNPQDSSIWSSYDGKVWNKEPLSGEVVYPLSFGNSVVFKDRLWVIGGRSLDNGPQNNVWSSADGNYWSEEERIFLPRYGHTSFISSGKIWVVAGADENGVQGDVWSSSDGEDWNKIAINPGFSPRIYHAMARFNNKWWLIGGQKNIDEFLNDVWSSFDGVNWSLETDIVPFSARSSHTLTVFNNELWLIGGNDTEDKKNDKVWHSKDGQNWLSIPSIPFSARSGHTVTVFDGRMWLFGGQDNNENILDDLWSSVDGISWVQQPSTVSLPTARWRHAVLTDKKAMWIIGGETKGRLPLADIWRTIDGEKWEQVLDKGSFSPRYEMTADIFDDRFWIIGGYANDMIKNDIWYSN